MNPPTVPAAIAAMSEKEWQEQVTQLLRMLGWKWMHVRRSLGRGKKWTTATNVDGYPDLTCWNERQQRLVFIELKSEKGRLTDDQRKVHASLRAAGCEVHVYRPSEFDDLAAWLRGAS